MSPDDSFLKAAVRLAAASVKRGGGPFGAVIVKGRRIVGSGCNRVVPDGDPTAHAEIRAIRASCLRLRTFSLEGCVLYSSCEPCPMCRAAALWARVERIVFASTRRDAARAGFDDEEFHRELRLRPRGRLLPVKRNRRVDGDPPFDAWRAKADRVPY